jgi:ABC-2 type transport system ATP-binding protein
VCGVSKTYLPPPRLLRPLVRSAARAPVHALRRVDLDVPPGRIVGLVGPNGAGKSTLMRIVASLLTPTTGTVRIAGADVTTRREEACRHLGLVLEGDRGVYDRMTGAENLGFFAAMAGLDRRATRRRVPELLELVGLAGRDKLVFGYSAGMRMRLSIARALVAEPALLVLDEPTRSLDPLASRATSRLLRDLAAQGHAVLISNHRLDEVVSTCSDVVAIVGGEVRYQGPTEGLATGPGGRGATLGDLLEREAGIAPAATP